MNAIYFDIKKKGTTDMVVRITKENGQLMAAIMRFDSTPLTRCSYFTNTYKKDLMDRVRCYLRPRGYRFKNLKRFMAQGTGII